MKRWIALLALVCLVPTTAMAGEPRAHIDDALTTFVAAFNAGDGATVASLYTEDAALYPPGGTPRATSPARSGSSPSAFPARAA
jgi:ketosteroid isomerase-like protein